MRPTSSPLWPLNQPSASSPSSGRLLALGDIHGCHKPLDALLEAASPTASDTLVVLGDFVDRGPATSAVIQRLLQLQQQVQLVVLMGNHEEQMLGARSDARAAPGWLSMGGRETLASYAQADLATPPLTNIPDDHWRFIQQALPYWECDDFIFTHAGYEPHLPLAQQSSMSLRWVGLTQRTPWPHCSGKTAIVGHTPNIDGRIVDFGFLRCLDTGCGLGGRLSLMDVRSGQLWQCPENSEKVIWS